MLYNLHLAIFNNTVRKRTQRAFYQPDFTINHLPRWGMRWQVWQTSLQPTQKIPFRGYITLWSSKLFLCPVAKHNKDSKHARQHTDAVKHRHKPTRAHVHTPFAWWMLIRIQSWGIMWFKQSRDWQTCSPAELKINPNTLRGQIMGPCVNLA